jgi:hypothetical protein
MKTIPDRLQLLAMPKTSISLWKIFTSGFVLSHLKLGIYGSGRPPPRHRALLQPCQTILLHRFHGLYFKNTSYIQPKKEIHCHQNSPLSRMSETEDFKPDISRKTTSTTSFPPSSRATSSAPSIIPGDSENPINISDSDEEEDFIPPSAKELAERRRLNHAVKEEPKDNVLKSVPVKGEYCKVLNLSCINLYLYRITGRFTLSFSGNSVY